MLTLKIRPENVSHFKSGKINNFLDPERARIRQIKWNYFNKCYVSRFQTFPFLNSIGGANKSVDSKITDVQNGCCRNQVTVLKMADIGYFRPQQKTFWLTTCFLFTFAWVLWICFWAPVVTYATKYTSPYPYRFWYSACFRTWRPVIPWSPTCTWEPSTWLSFNMFPFWTRVWSNFSSIALAISNLSNVSNW